MVATCLQVVGFVTSFVGWIGIIVTTSTNDWVVTCGYTIPTCRKLDELGSKGLWADCVMATGLYHCKPLVDILILPGYVQACRALMIAASVLGLPAILLLLTVLPCIRMGHEPGVAKYRRAQLAGVMLILLGKTAFYLAPRLRVNLMNRRSCLPHGVQEACERKPKVSPREKLPMMSHSKS
ncbi:claudin-11 isoform X2 [Vulpes vulpes]|uniref:Claudin n=1 Tax=Vulpes vulpes TaxID=9627 RepID=A0ABM5A0M6_VULVU